MNGNRCSLASFKQAAQYFLENSKLVTFFESFQIATVSPKMVENSFFFFFSHKNLTFCTVFEIKWSKFPKMSLPVGFNQLQNNTFGCSNRCIIYPKTRNYKFPNPLPLYFCYMKLMK